MRKNLTELVFILDRSGSMLNMVDDVIGGFNDMISRQQEEPGQAWVTTVLFSTDTTMLHDWVPLRDVRPMTRKDFRVGGGTALMDAVGETVKHIADIHRYARPQDVPARTLFVITTDGMENASRNFDAREIRSLISRQRRDADWEFLFLGANIDAAETARSYGIPAERAAQWQPDGEGARRSFDVLSETVACVRACEAIPASWSKGMMDTPDEE